MQNNGSPWVQFGNGQKVTFNSVGYQQGMYNNQGYQNYGQPSGYSNPNYNMPQNFGFNYNNQPPIPFSTNNITRKNILNSETIANGQKFAG